MADRHEAGGFMTQTGTDALIDELYLRDYWIDKATLTRRLDEILADKSAQNAQEDLVRLYAAVYQTRWSEVLRHPLLAQVDHEAAMRRIPPGADVGGQSELLVAVATATLVPFIQSIAAAAGSRAFEEARTRLASLMGRRQYRRLPSITIHEDETGLSFDVPSGLPNKALEALAAADLEALAAPDSRGRSVVICWDIYSGTWVRQVRGR
ncbi:hypothetical protein N8I84_41225 (plasmid) [Streptomyces cynarae]|uniref:Uncharacterized protein n=1 Tax=Streptomyces cynarae TaxID=2981134 RepID=A0ABY6EDM9_9ACTN|nr:hypothetical protein [Streptomyces cynarae]UXY24874.1 hypothetical protein N8I84_41225 [Streptomyces cynarae]